MKNDNESTILCGQCKKAIKIFGDIYWCDESDQSNITLFHTECKSKTSNENDDVFPTNE